MIERLKSKEGFTLVELIIAIAVTTVIMGTITLMVVQSHKSYYKVTNESEVMNVMNSVLENIREATFNSSTLKISNETALPTLNSGETAFTCIDNSIYLDENLMHSGSSMGVANVSLKFSKASEKKIKCEISMKNESGKDIIQSQSVELFLNNVNQIQGDSDGNCIIFTK